MAAVKSSRGEEASLALVLEIERLLRGPPLPQYGLLQQIHAALLHSSPPLPPTSAPPPRTTRSSSPPQPAVAHRGSAEINRARNQKIRRLQRQMESAPVGGIGSRLAMKPTDNGEPHMAKTFLQRAHELANKPEVREGYDNNRDMRFDPASHRQPLPPERVWMGR